MKDSWESGDPYDYFMGRWSRLVAQLFVQWLSPRPELRWLDIGCGPGALSEAIVTHLRVATLTAVDQSESFVRMAQKRLGDRAQSRVGDALHLPLAASSVDTTVSGLLLNFIPDPGKALVEMKRVTAPGGTVGAYVWDYAGKMDFLKLFWDAAVELKPEAADLHESRRFSETNDAALKKLFAHAGLNNIVTAPIEIPTHFQNFDDYWQPFLGGQGPAPSFVMSLDEAERDALRTTLEASLPFQPDGSVDLQARAWAVKGTTSM